MVFFRSLPIFENNIEIYWPITLPEKLVLERIKEDVNDYSQHTKKASERVVAAQNKYCLTTFMKVAVFIDLTVCVRHLLRKGPLYKCPGYCRLRAISNFDYYAER